MKERILGMYCIFAVIYGAFEVGHVLGSQGVFSIGGISCTLACGAILGGIVWSKRDGDQPSRGPNT